MSGHWRLALRCSAWVIALAVPAGGAVFYVYGGTHAGAFLYGVGVGVVSFVSTALTVTLLTGRSTTGGMLVGGSSFVVRYGFAAGALGVPAYLGLWPVVAMLGGFVAVYVVETVVLVPWALRAIGDPGAGRPAGEGVERRAEA
jgi:hypothetical protein